MPDDKDKISSSDERLDAASESAATKSISEKTWEDDDDWMEDPSGINPGC